MKRFISRVIWIVIFLGGLFTYDGVKDTSDSKKKPVDFATMKEADIKAGTIVEGDLEYNYGAFEESYRTTYGIKTGDSDYTYLIPIGEKYMGLKTQTTEQQATLEQQANSTIDLYLGNSSVQPAVFHFKGRIVALTGEDQGYMKDYLVSMGYQENTVNQYMVNYCIECVDFSGGIEELTIGLLLLVVGIVVLLAPWVEEHRRQKRTKAAYESLQPATSNYAERRDPFESDPTDQNIYNDSTSLKINTYSENTETIGDSAENQDDGGSENKPTTGLRLKLKDD